MAAASLNLTNGAQLGHLPSERPLVASLRALNGRGRGPRQLCDGLPCAGAGGRRGQVPAASATMAGVLVPCLQPGCAREGEARTGKAGVKDNGAAEG